MRYLSVPLVVALLATHASAGISYYSNVTNGTENKAAFSVTNASGPQTLTWNPLSGADTNEANAGFIITRGNTSLTGTSLTSTGFDMYLSKDTSFDELQSLSTSTVIGFDHFGSLFNNGASATVARADNSALNLDETGYAGGDSYFGWALWDTNNSNLYAIGWAKWSLVNPPASNVGAFTISEWGYNLGASATITIGDTSGPHSENPASSSPSVPEPTGLAVFGLLVVGSAVIRRRR